MSIDFSSKQAARQAVWDRLKNEKLAAFPFPPHGRIPNFKGAKDAAMRLFDEPEWRDAKLIKVNPDSPQKYVRAEALRRGITVYVPTPRLKAGFLKLDPTNVPFDAINDASQMSKVGKWAEPVDLTDLPPPLTSVQAGETWNFTTWYRDVNPMPTSNFTDGVSVTFE